MPKPVIYICTAMLFIAALAVAVRPRCGGVQPHFIKIHLPKEVWVLIDIAAGVFLLVSSKRISGIKEVS